ncbi:MAG: YceI family protein [Phycisphaerales bacterium]|jgi:polyisoprenoid-binding protein YceI|nr:YceI family protein [Phycisphaerales bacterium]
MDTRTKRAGAWSVGAAVVVAGLAAGIVGISGGSIATAADPAPALAEKGEYVIDAVHSSVLFEIMHMGVAPNHGRFNDMSGTFTYDESTGAISDITFTVKAESVDTNSKQRDDHLRGPDFFSVKEFPEISFTSTKVTKAGDVFRAEGTLDFHGVSKSISVDIRVTGTGKDPWNNLRTGFTTEFKVDRTAYGVDYRPDVLGTEVTLTVSAEGVRKP